MDAQAATVKVLAHFEPGDSVLETVAAESDWLDVTWCAPEDDDTFYRQLPDAEVVWHVLRPLSGADLATGARLRLVHKLGSGINTIDVDAATERDIAVANMPGANAPSVAEGAVLLMLAAQRRLLTLDPLTRAGRGWPSDPELGQHCRDIGGCTVGLIGYGNVAKALEPMLAAMGATVVHTSTRDDGLATWRDLATLLAESDIVSLHLPLTDATHNLIDDAALAAMRPGAVLVNTSRGPVVDEAALVAALRDRRLAAAGLDVFAVEPVEPDNPILGLDNVVLTPHVSWYTVDTMARYLDVALDNCRRLRDGAPLANVVNPPLAG